MKEVTGNMWEMGCDALCITTNGNIKSNGEAVMGRGVALQCAKKYPYIPKRLGWSLKMKGNHCVTIEDECSPLIIAFPTKVNWWEKSNIDLIRESAKELNDIVLVGSLKKVLLPRPGCANGGLRWELVKYIIEPHLNDSVYVVNYV